MALDVDPSNVTVVFVLSHAHSGSTWLGLVTVFLLSCPGLHADQANDPAPS